MSRCKKTEKLKVVKAKMLAAERDRMERLCIITFMPMRGYNERKRLDEWSEKVHAMTDAELVKEFNKRDGDHILERGCAPEDEEE